MKIKASMLIMSHLSDAQEMLNMLDDHKFANSINGEINFAKWILMKLNGDVNQEIDADEIYKEYKEYKKL